MKKNSTLLRMRNSATVYLGGEGVGKKYRVSINIDSNRRDWWYIISKVFFSSEHNSRFYTSR